MGEYNASRAAAARLNTAFEVLEARSQDQAEAKNALAVLKAEFDYLTEERSKLHSNLQSVQNRAQALENANQEVENRLHSVIDSFKSVLSMEQR